MTRIQSFGVKWLIRPLLSLGILELGLVFTPIPDWWEAGVFDHHLLSTRCMNWVGWFFFEEYNSLGYRDGEWSRGGKKIVFWEIEDLDFLWMSIKPTLLK